MVAPEPQSLRERARQLRHNSTSAERRLWVHLRNRQIKGAKFRRQHPIDRLITDFCSPEHRIVIELDGGHHSLRKAEDNTRDALLAEAGYRILRFWNNEVMENIDGVLERIRLAVIAAHPHPDPLPARERGHSGAEGSEKCSCPAPR